MVRRVGAAAITAALVSALVAVAAPAGATPSTGGEHGVVLIHTSGSLYAGPHAFVAQTTLPGGSVTYVAQIKNTGADPAQFLFRVNNPQGYHCTPSPHPARARR